MSFISIKAQNWYKAIRREFSGDQYWKWLKASYSTKTAKQSSLQTGDLLLIKARLPFADEEAELNQLAMIIRNPSQRIRDAYQLAQQEELFALEATIGQQNRKEIQIVPLQELLQTYQALYGQDLLYVYRKLEMPDHQERDMQSFPELENWLLAIKGKHYSKEKEALYQLIWGKDEAKLDMPALSSQLISVTYKEMGLIKKEEMYRYLKLDFLRQIRYGWELSRIRLLKGAALCRGMMLEWA